MLLHSHAALSFSLTFFYEDKMIREVILFGSHPPSVKSFELEWLAGMGSWDPPDSKGACV